MHIKRQVCIFTYVKKSVWLSFLKCKLHIRIVCFVQEPERDAQMCEYPGWSRAKLPKMECYYVDAVVITVTSQWAR